MANYAGTTGNDNITGTSGVDTIHDGGGGNDVLKGEGSNDIITVTGGSDTVKGGAEAFEGYDILVVDYAGKTAAVRTLVNDDGFAAGPGDIVKHVGIERVSVMGGSGDDSLRGMAGRDTLLGGLGDDTLDGGDSNDTMEGGDGIDTVTYAALDAGYGVEVNLALNQADHGGGVDRLVGIERVIGGDGYDLLYGGAGDDTMMGGKGYDSLRGGLGGDDRLMGENGNDTIDSSGGADTIDGGSGDDLLSLSGSGARLVQGGAGADWLTIDFSDSSAPVTSLANGYTNGAGSSVIFAGIERLDVTGGTGSDSLRGTKGSDRLTGGSGKDTIDGGKGDDYVSLNDGVAKGGAGLDRLSVNFSTSSTSVTTLPNGSFTNGALTVAHSGFETLSITGGSAADTLSGGDGLDTLTGNAGNDSLSGGDGADRLGGGLGADTLAGGRGIDTATYAGLTGALTVDLNMTGVQDTGAGGLDLLIGIENLIGTSGADTLIGDKEDNRLEGASGADTLFGGSGDDFLEGGLGVSNANNSLVGGKGDDTIRAGDLNGSDTLEGGEGIDTLLLFKFSFSTPPPLKVDLDVTSAQDTGAGMDVITGFENAISASGADSLSGSAGANRLEGADGSDTLTGRGGADTLIGGKGGDLLSGGADADRFIYLATDDSRTGLGLGVDQITDFDAADLIDLSAIDAVASSAATNEAFSFVAAFTGVAGQATLAYDSGANLTTVRADTDGDSVADFELGVTGELTSGDFVA